LNKLFRSAQCWALRSNMGTRARRLLGVLLMTIGLLIVVKSGWIVGNMLILGLAMMVIGPLITCYEAGDGDTIARVAGWTCAVLSAIALWLEMPMDDVTVIFLLAMGCFVYLWRDWIGSHFLPIKE